MRIVHVILSGGVGSRLWPVSRKSMPKQYIPMFGEKSLFQLTIERNKAFADEVLIVGNKDNYTLSQSDLAKAGVTSFSEIIEAAPRNTAAAIAFAALSVNPEDVLLVTPSDHIITNEAEYAQAISDAISLAKDGAIATFGIVPSKPETGYGYIEHEGNDVLSFREKPDLQTAFTFLESGRFLWNSGMFCFQARVFLDELNAFEPEILEKSLQTLEAKEDGFLPQHETMQIPSKSIDYAVMERSEKIKVIKAKFNWSDLGSFESIWTHWEEQGESHRFINNNCVINASRHVEFLGVENLVYVETEDAVLILDKRNSQDVKKIYDRLEAEKPELII